VLSSTRWLSDAALPPDIYTFGDSVIVFGEADPPLGSEVVDPAAPDHAPVPIEKRCGDASHSESASRKILTSRSTSLLDMCSHVAAARLSAREGLPQQALNRVIVAASFGSVSSRVRLPNGSPAAAGKLCRSYNQSLTISNQKPCYRGGRW
jgi:hypothetical protein